MSKLYTKTGDKGYTNLYDMRRVPKSNLIFDVLGDLDELSAHIGQLCSYSLPQQDLNFLRKIQTNLLDIGSDFATKTRRNNIKIMTHADVVEIENAIDYYDSKSPKLTEFILPGVNAKDSSAHVCRSVSRRVERNMWKSKDDDKDFYVQKETFHYINRLSDFFFAFARYLSEGKETTRSQAINSFSNEST